MNNEIKTVSPFKNFCITLGNLPTSYLESMSYYETLCWLIKYLENTLKPAVNQNAEALKELQSYVENLDLTDEVNARLDEMAEDGTLAEIINNEIFTNLSNRVTNVENQLKLNNIKALSINDFTGDTSIIDEFYSGYITWNNDSSWFKCFLYMRITNDGSNKSVRIPLPNGFTVTETYNIGFAGDYFREGLHIGAVDLQITPTEIILNLPIDGTVNVKYNPYLYFNGEIEI